jgi:hypothetical protein
MTEKSIDGELADRGLNPGRSSVTTLGSCIFGFVRMGEFRMSRGLNLKNGPLQSLLV